MTEKLPSTYDFEVQREGFVQSAIRDAENGDTSYLVRLLREPGGTPEVVRLWIANDGGIFHFGQYSLISERFSGPL